VGIFVSTNPFREDLLQYWKYQELRLITPTNSTIPIVQAATELLDRLFIQGLKEHQGEPGAKYDAHGFENNWWADEDMANFKLLHQKMIDRYNELEQAPGVMADGEMTLNENIADLGGMALAYDLWNKKLQADGLSGQQLRHQQRQFFVSYADTWKSYTTDEKLIKQKKKDKHSANHNRVNGLSRLSDDWYTLFGVEPGDKLYVAPADRVKIW
jgi:putative endopeptidase